MLSIWSIMNAKNSSSKNSKQTWNRKREKKIVCPINQVGIAVKIKVKLFKFNTESFTFV